MPRSPLNSKQSKGGHNDRKLPCNNGPVRKSTNEPGWSCRVSVRTEAIIPRQTRPCPHRLPDASSFINCTHISEKYLDGCQAESSVSQCRALMKEVRSLW